MTTSAILIYCISYSVLAWKRLDWALLVLIAAMPAYVIRFNLVIPFTLLEAMVLIAFVVWLIKDTKFRMFLTGKYGWKQFKSERKNRKRYPYSSEIILMLLISYAAAAVSGFSTEALGIWKAYFFEPVLVYIMVLNVFREKEGIKNIFWALSVSMLAVSLFGFYQKITGDFIPNEFWAAADTRRITSFFGYPNAVGLYLGPLILLMVGFIGYQIRLRKHLIRKERILFLYLFMVVLFSLFSLYFAKSEGALIAVLAGLVFYFLLSGKRTRIATVVILLLSAAGIYAYTPLRTYAFEKMSLKDLSGEIRKQQWRETQEMLGDGRLLLGSGLANYQRTIEPYHQEGIFFNRDRDPDFRRKIFLFDEEYKEKYWQPTEVYLYPHNIVLNFWVELGVAGALLFIWLIAKFLFKGIRLTETVRTKAWIKDLKPYPVNLIKGLVGAMAVVVVHGLVDVPYFKNDLALMFWLMFALLSLMEMNFWQPAEKVNHNDNINAGKD